jgi:two-component system phosphate regulon response regulator PhoB
MRRMMNRGKTMSKATVLVIDDEPDLIELVRYNLDKEGFDVVASSDGESGLEIARRRTPDLIVLDLMMPGMDGLSVCRALRGDERTSRIPLIMLTARAAETDRVVGLEMGADDYVTKPFSPRELVARIRSILRRVALPREPNPLIRQGNLVVDLVRHEVLYNDVPVTLTATEFRILQFLAARPGRVVSRNEIMDAAIGPGANVFDRTIDVHITAIRRKLGEGGGRIETIRGFGYKLRDRDPD